jgi:uncharacterized protein YndB with AHSA1/START domain
MSRSQEHELEIRARIEDVWRALVDADELTRWFFEEARVEPGAGGSVWGSWGEGMDGETRIDVWEPPNRLRLLDRFGGALEEPMIQEYVLETRGGTTVLRFVHSDIPDAPDWEGIYESLRRGWGLFFRNLRHYLERHPGERRQSRYAMHAVEGTASAAWSRLLGRGGLGLDGGEPSAGSRYTATTGDGDRLEGFALTVMPTARLQLTLEPLDDGLLTLSIEGTEEEPHVWYSIATFGEGESPAADRLADRVHATLAATA